MQDLFINDGVFKRVVSIMGIDVLIKPLNEEEVTPSGIIIPDSKDDVNKLSSGHVRLKGSGYLIPSLESDSILENEKDFKPRYIKLDLEEGDLVYYPTRVAAAIRLNNQNYVLVPYPTIRVRIREELN